MPVVRRLLPLILALVASVQLFAAKTWFVRVDGGTRYSAHVPTGQCDGLADVPFSGRGVNQHCAFNDVRYMWLDGSVGNGGWVMSGGDTLVIRGCKALPSQQNADSPHCRIGWDKAAGNDKENFWCWYADAYCSIPPPPNGTAAQPTRILGGCAFEKNTCNPLNGYPFPQNNLTQLFGGFGLPWVLSLKGSRYVDLEGLEITSHNGQCTRHGYPQWPSGCRTDRPMSDFADNGIFTTNTTANITMRDVYIHGFSNGILGPIGGAFNLARVSIDFNSFAGWNFDDGHSTPNGPGSSIEQSHLSMVGNGCLEEYPISHPQFPAKACWDSSSGGFGDSWSGQDANLEGFTCDHCTIIYNAKDAAIGPHTHIKHLSLTNSTFAHNMGQQGKWSTQADSTAVIQNNLIIGDCFRMSQQIPGAAQNFSAATKQNGSYLSNFCRAAGDIFAISTDARSSLTIQNNTIVALSPTVFDLTCNTSGSCASSPYNFTNNIVLGYTDPSYPGSSGQAPGLYYKSDPKVVIVGSHNLEFGVRNGDGCGQNGNVCADPRFVNEPHQRRPDVAAFDHFDMHPSQGSPAIRNGKPTTASTDFYGQRRNEKPSIGAAEPGQ